LDQQKKFEPDRELHSVEEAPRLVFEGNDPAAVRIAVEDDVFPWMGEPPRGELTQHVRRNGHRLAEHRLTDIDRHVLCRIDRFCELRRAGRDPLLAFGGITVELKMREMQ